MTAAAPAVKIEALEAIWLEADDASHFLSVVADGQEGIFGPVDQTVATFALARLAPLLAGAELTARLPDRAQLLACHRHAGTGLGAVAIGAVDCALWDLRGKLAGRPVFELLGGRRRDAVPAYASLLGTAIGSEAAPALATEALAAGFAGVKWALRERPAADRPPDLSAVERIRAAIGAEAPLMLDALGGWDLAYAEAWCREAQSLGLHWLEDPLPARDLVGLASLATSSGVPIAAGEQAYGLDEARTMLRFGRVSALLSDIAWCGISDGWAIAAACEAAGVPLCPHGAGLLPALHLAAARPNVVPMVEYHLSLEPRRQRWFADPVEPRDGRLAPPDGPGLGIELRPDLLAAAKRATEASQLWPAWSAGQARWLV